MATDAILFRVEGLTAPAETGHEETAHEETHAEWGAPRPNETVAEFIMRADVKELVAWSIARHAEHVKDMARMESEHQAWREQFRARAEEDLAAFRLANETFFAELKYRQSA